MALPIKMQARYGGHTGPEIDSPSLPSITSRDGGFGRPFIGRGIPFNDNLSPSAASNPMAIRGSDHSYVPPPLPPPPLVPVDGPVDPNIQFMKHRRREDHGSPLGDSFGVSFERREVSFKRFPDEGYQSMDSLRSDSSSQFMMRRFHPDNRSIDSSMLSKLDRRPQLSASATDLPPPRANHTHLSAISLPDRTKHQSFLDAGMTRSPLPLSAVSPYSQPSSAVEYRSPLGLEPSDFDRSPRTRRTNSGSVPDDATISTQGSYEAREDDGDFPMETSGMGALKIEGSWGQRRDREREDHYQAGQKRRASSPPSDDMLLPVDGMRRREGMPLTRGSPTPRLTVPQGQSFSGISSASRGGGYSSNLSASMAGLGPLGRCSPVALSPGGLSPIDSPYAPPHSAAASPRSAIGRSMALQSPHQRNISEQAMMAQSGRTMASPRRLAEIPKNHPSSLVAAKMKGPYMCECCPKKPKKFDTEEDLKIHEAEKQYECLYCGNRFKNKNEAERHQNSLHVRRHSWSCSALTTYERAFHDSTTKPGEADTCGYCGEEFPRSGRSSGGGFTACTDQDWEERIHHLQNTHKFRECNSSKKFYRADHFRQHLKHSHAGTSGKWTNMLENACMLEEEPPLPTR